MGGPLTAQKVVYVGDGNNIATSLIEASARLDFPLTVITPAGYAPDEAVVARARSLSRDGDRVTITSDLSDLDGATAIYTDVWTSMGQESERQSRRKIFAEYQVNPALMAGAPKAVFMHCLPAHRGEEVTDEVIDGPRSIVFDEAENRVHAQKGILAWCLR